VFVVTGIAGLFELVRWVIAATTALQREQRGKFARDGTAVALDAVNRDHMNAQLRSALRPDPFATPKTSATAASRN